MLLGLVVVMVATVVVSVARIQSLPGSDGTPTPGPTPTALTGYVTYANETHGLAISCPEDWLLVSEDLYSEDDVLIVQADTACGELPSVLRVKKTESPSPFTLEEYYQSVRTSYNATQGYSFVSDEEITVDGVPAMEHVYTMDIGQGTVEVMQVLFLEDTTLWILSCEAAAACWPAYEPTFDVVVASFQFL